MSTKSNPFERVLHAADTLHEVAMDDLRPDDFRQIIRKAARGILKEASARPILALAIAGALGFFAGSVINR